MKQTSILLAAATAFLSCFSGSASAATIVAGTKIGLAPGPNTTNTVGNDWFDFSAPGTYNTIHNLDGVTLTGVSVTVAGGGFIVAGEDNWVGLSTNGGSAPAEFVDSVTTDLLFGNTTITINGLNTALTYNLYSVSHGGGSGLDSREDTHTGTSDISYGSITVNRGDARVNGTFHTFLGVSPNGSGQIVFATTQLPDNNPAFNGLLIVAVPEPCSVCSRCSADAGKRFSSPVLSISWPRAGTCASLRLFAAR